MVIFNSYVKLPEGISQGSCQASYSLCEAPPVRATISTGTPAARARRILGTLNGAEGDHPQPPIWGCNATFEQGTHASVKNTTAYIYIYICMYIYITIIVYNCILYIWRNISFPLGYCIPWGKPNNQANDKPSILGKMVVHSMVYTSTVHSAYGTLSIINRHVVGKFWL